MPLFHLKFQRLHVAPNQQQPHERGSGRRRRRRRRDDLRPLPQSERVFLGGSAPDLRPLGRRLRQLDGERLRRGRRQRDPHEVQVRRPLLLRADGARGKRRRRRSREDQGRRERRRLLGLARRRPRRLWQRRFRRRRAAHIRRRCLLSLEIGKFELTVVYGKFIVIL